MNISVCLCFNHAKAWFACIFACLYYVTASFEVNAQTKPNDDLTEIRDLISQFSFSHPVKVLDSVKKLSKAQLTSLSNDDLFKAMHVAVNCLEFDLTMELTEILLSEEDDADEDEKDLPTAMAYYYRGLISSKLGNYNSALFDLLSAFDIFTYLKNEEGVARVKSIYGEMSVEFDYYEDAEEYFSSAAESLTSDKQIFEITNLLLKRAVMYIQLKEYKKAEEDLNRSLELVKKSNNLSSYPELYINLGKLNLAKKDFSVALEYFMKAKDAANFSQLNFYESQINLEIARVYLAKNPADTTIVKEKLNESIQIAKKYGLLKELKKSYSILLSLDVKAKNYQAIYQWGQKINEVKQKIANDLVICYLTELDGYAENLQEQEARLVLIKEKEIAELDAEKSRLIRNFLILISVIAILSAIYFIWRFKHSTKQSAIYEQQSKIDPLTGVWNRRAGESHLARLCRRDAGIVKVFSIAMLDIDNFKRVNDQFGHDVGDKVIVSVCNIVQDCLRPTDMLCRWGGEEFVLILEHFDSSKAFEICERIRKKIKSTKIEKVDSMTVSIGISMFQDDDLFELVRRGDQALYKAKDLGRNMVVIKDKES